MSAAAIPLITSLPPVMSRKAADGSEIGLDYLGRCIRSWVDSGFSPISVNAESEASPAIAEAARVTRIDARRDARAICGKPLVFFDDLIAAARTCPPGPVAITNSDILLECPEETMAAFRATEPGQFHAVKRIDISDPDTRTGEPYKAGYDLFVIHSADLASLSLAPFVFGLPWWDYRLPFALLASGRVLADTPSLPAFHLIHEGRWDQASWTRIGQHHFSDCLDDARKGQTDGAGDRRALAGFRARLEKAFPDQARPVSPIGRLGRAFGLAKPAEPLGRPQLLALSRMTRAFIEAQRPGEAASEGRGAEG